MSWQYVSAHVILLLIHPFMIHLRLSALDMRQFSTDYGSRLQGQPSSPPSPRVDACLGICADAIFLPWLPVTQHSKLFVAKIPSGREEGRISKLVDSLSTDF
jgi:hypothetical protein